MKQSVGWFISVIITLSVAVFQFLMGTADPLSTEVTIGKQRYQCELRRSFIGNSDCPVVLNINDILVSGYILYKSYPSDNEATRIEFDRQGDKLVGKLPAQRPSERLEYRIVLEREGKSFDVSQGNPVIVRFLGRVPVTVLILSGFFVFITLLLIIYSGMLAALGIRTYRGLIYLNVSMLLGVVFILQPVVHKYSLNQWWTCAPKSWELGDNKLLLASVIWLFTMWFNFRKQRPGLVIIASIISLLLFSVPHGFPGLMVDAITSETMMRKLMPVIQLF